MDIFKLLKYLPQAQGVYGKGVSTPALSTGNFAPVKVNASTSSGFQAVLYQDESTGQYRMAIAGTNDILKGDQSKGSASQ